MKIIKLLFLALFLVAMLSACSNEQETTTETQTPTDTVPKGGETDHKSEVPTETTANEKETREEKIEALKALIPAEVTKRPETVEEFATFPIGRFAGLRYVDHEDMMLPILQKLPKVEEQDKEIIDLYYLALLGLFAEDYPDPQQLIDQIKMASFGSPDIKDPRFQFKERYNVEIILDASGSMAATVDGKTKMEAAKEAIQAFAKSLPKQAHVALRVYGHKGSGQEKDKKLSCSSSELVYGMQPYDASKLQSALNQFQPTGYTPIAFSLQEAMKDLSQYPGDKNTNIIYLVSDGIETCDGNPVAAAKELGNSNITPIVNVIGFGVDGEGQNQLKEVAKAAGGRYILINNQEELQKEFQQTREIAFKWWQWQQKASFEAHMNRNNNLLDAHFFNYNWEMAARMENYNLFFVIRELGNRGMLSKEASELLVRYQEEQLELANKRREELKTFIDSLANKSYHEALDAISKQYSQSVKKE